MQAKARVENPLKTLTSAVGKLVLVKLKDGSEYVGMLERGDATMNIILRDCVELDGESVKVKYGRVLIRGSNVLYVSVDYGTKVNLY